MVISIKHANGEYCIFLDADDIFARNMISELVKIITRENADIVCFGFYYFVITPLIKKKNHLQITDIKISPNDVSDLLFLYDSGYPWNKFYRTSFLKKTEIEFSSTKRNNDVYFSRLTTVLAESIYFSSKRLLYYRIWNRNSLQGGNYKSPDDGYIVTKQIINELNSRGLSNNYNSSMERMVVRYCCYGDANYSYRDYEGKYRYSKELLSLIMNDREYVNEYENSEMEIVQSILEDDFSKYVFLMKSKSNTKEKIVVSYLKEILRTIVSQT